uniref:Metal transporter CNNM2 n=1 Tax=Aceria tosichella TaxID=561515 RepID=A0A6G1SNQ0_9ACAR
MRSASLVALLVSLALHLLTEATRLAHVPQITGRDYPANNGSAAITRDQSPMRPSVEHSETTTAAAAAASGQVGQRGPRNNETSNTIAWHALSEQQQYLSNKKDTKTVARAYADRQHGRVRATRSTTIPNTTTIAELVAPGPPPLAGLSANHNSMAASLSGLEPGAQRRAARRTRVTMVADAGGETAGGGGGLNSCELAVPEPAIHGIRCDECGEVLEGVLVIKANEPTQLMLIGSHFEANVSVALTPEPGQAQSDCTHADRIKSTQFTNVSSNIARALIEVPAAPDLRPYHLCLRDSHGHWRHQGDANWLKLYIKEDLLPVYMKIILVACLLMLSGLFSGLNLGLMALDKNELQVIISCGSDKEKRYARAIEPVRRRGNYLLCSILFSNVLVNSTIAVLLEELTSGIVAVMTSTIFIVMFGEILPQSFCSRHGLAVGAKTVSITYFCMIVTFPLSYPVSACLDWALGEEIGHAYDRERLMEFIRVTRDYNNLESDEVNIISGALKLKRIPLSEVMTRIEDVYMLDMSSCLDFDTIQAIIERGYSRVPVHEPGNKKNIVALLFAKDLALLDPDDRTPVQTLINFYNHPILFLFEDNTLDLALNEFKTGKSHMAFVRRVIDDGDLDPVYEITGIVTLEDVIEEIMQMEINDETDTLSDNKRKRRRKEAQVRGDFSQFTHFGAGEASFNLVSPQLCLAAYQYLATTVEPFSSKYISDATLRRLLSQRIYFRVRLDDDRHKEARRLYTAGEPVDYFVMILEGRVRVECGKEHLVFEGGPFSYFGKAALAPLDKLEQAATSKTTALGLMQDTAGEKPETDTTSGGVRRESVADLELTASGGPPVISLLRTSNNSNSGQDESKTKLLANSTSTNATTGTAGLTTSATKTAAATSSPSSNSTSLPRPSQSGGSLTATAVAMVERASAFIVPDYTVDIAADTSYLKVTRQEYLAALKATLVERGAAEFIGDREGGSPGARKSQSQRSSTVNASAQSQTGEP